MDLFWILKTIFSKNPFQYQNDLLYITAFFVHTDQIDKKKQMNQESNKTFRQTK